ncbi:hypothetical protein CBW22_17090 [Pantoea sp. VS1]|nr:hypothetical protein CBW22_17090 [Pantoea sp. VS1]
MSFSAPGNALSHCFIFGLLTNTTPHLDNTRTYEHETYLLVPESKVFFNPQKNNVVVVDKTGNFVS